MVNKDKFLINFKTLFDEEDISLITLNTKFKDLDEWDSMTSLSLIALFDSEYNLTINGDDILSSETVNDLYNLLLKLYE
ncbi:MAG: acyl carrier protein [Cytophagia bacterium]|nr:acyl carrier protein [Cytophagia bacterium]